MTRVPVRRALAAGIGVATLATVVVAGATAAGAAPKNQPTGPVPLQLLAINDFHGQLETPSGSSSRLDGYTATTLGPFGGSEYLATQIKQLEAQSQQANTLTVAAGDLIGASPLLSAAYHDEPTIEALNLVGLDFAAVGNHEFDEGVTELLRMQNGGCLAEDSCPAGEFQGADWQYLTANSFYTDSGETVLPPIGIKKVQGIKVGFIGMTLEGTPGVVTPSGVAGLSFVDEADTANKYARILQRAGAETIVVLMHEGGAQEAAPPNQNTNDINGCKNLAGPVTDIVPRMSSAIDVVITGHTHNAYNCRQLGSAFLPASSGTGRLVTSASSVGRLVTDIDLTLDPTTGDVLTSTANNVPVVRTVAKDADQTALINRYTALVAPIRDQVVGKAATVIARAPVTPLAWTTATGTARTGNGDSALGNLIADGQLDATPTSVAAFMNPGGVRADINPADDITYGEAFAVQPFGNFLSQITMTDAQLQCLLEQQYALGTVLQPAGITYSVSRSGVAGTTANPCSGTVVPDNSVKIGTTAIATDGIDSYRITVNNFLADGGDSFSVFTQATNRQDVSSPEDDLAALVQYLGKTAPTSAPAIGRITQVD
jgi:5'-nucleotidase